LPSQTPPMSRLKKLSKTQMLGISLTNSLIRLTLKSEDLEASFLEAKSKELPSPELS